MRREFSSSSKCFACGGSGKQFSRAKINKAIAQSGLSWKQVADALAISEAYISRLRSGSRRWTPGYVEKLQKLLNHS